MPWSQSPFPDSQCNEDCRFRSQRKVDYLGALESALQTVDKAIKKEETRTEENVGKSEERKRFLDNEIHKTMLKVMEAEMVQSKLENILSMLKKDRLTYSSSIEELEHFIREQKGEISQLQKVIVSLGDTLESPVSQDYDESIMFREESREEMKQEEEGFQQEGKVTLQS